MSQRSMSPAAAVGMAQTAVGSSTPIRIRTWNSEEFATSRGEWDGLVARSDADPLFMSWDWQWRWWKHHAPVLDATLRLAAVYAGEQLVGLAPFYLRTVTVRRLLRVRRLELIGIAWRDPRAMFSDYLDIIAAHGSREVVIDTLDQWLAADPFWDELALCCTKRSGIAAMLATERLGRWAFVREVDPLTGWCALLPHAFEHYVKRLSPEVRRKLFNQRRKLAGPRLDYATEAELEETLATLWRFSAERWAGEVPATHVQDFHREMAAHLSRAGELRLSRMTSEKGMLSVLYSVQRRGTVYYLQSGFDPARAQGLSLGYLHFGYAIEAACNQGVRQFDFLAGRGRHRDYKRDLLTEHVPVVSYHAARGVVARALYTAYELVHGRRKSLQEVT